MAWSFLVVDPDLKSAEQLETKLLRVAKEVTVEIATSGEDALDVLLDGREMPSMVFYEYRTVDINGLEFLSEIHGNSHLQHQPIAILGESFEGQQIVNCYRLGAEAVIGKPTSTHELRETIREHAAPSTRLPKIEKQSA